MRILWISNIPFGKLSEMAGQAGGNTSGSWLNAALDAFRGDPEHQFVVTTVGDTKRMEILTEGNITYGLLPGGPALRYNRHSRKNRKIWEKIRLDLRPDLIHVWGTEFAHGHLALQVMPEIPAVIYMQGVMSQIARHYLAGLTDRELRSARTIRDIIKRDGIKQAQKKFRRRSLIEADMIRMAGQVIVENEWCAAHCRSAAPHCLSHKSKLPIRDEYFRHQWDPNRIEPRTVMSNAPGYPVKGLHMLLKAFGLVAQKYPQARLYVPGEASPFHQSARQRLKQTGYTKFIKTIIRKRGLEDHVHFLGRLSPAEVAGRMARSNVFVMPSSIENHSSMLIEAMIVGTPCVSSSVGGIPEYLESGRNGLLYRFEDYEVLASHILRLFDNPREAAQMGLCASERMRQSRKATHLKAELADIYQRVFAAGRNV